MGCPFVGKAAMERENGRTRRIKIISMGAAESGKVGAARAPHRTADEV